MRRTAFFSACLLCVSLSFACGRPSQATAVTEVGCVTATGDRFVLTSLESGEMPATELYQLVGTNDELRQHVGREVLVTGEAQPAAVAEVRERRGDGAGARRGGIPDRHQYRQGRGTERGSSPLSRAGGAEDDMAAGVMNQGGTAEWRNGGSGFQTRMW